MSLPDRIHAYLEENGPSTVSDIANFVSMGPTHVRDALKRLKARKQVEHVYDVMVEAGKGWATAAVYAAVPKPEPALTEGEDRLVTDPVVRKIVPAPARAEDVRAVLAKQPELVRAWQ